jgi:predicted nucleotidyltransferase
VTTKLYLDDYNLHIMQHLLKKWVPGYLIIAFGSRVKGHAHEGSDLDLVIKNIEAPENPCTTIAELQQAIKESNVTILIDILDWATIPEAFRTEINKNYVIFQHGNCNTN